VGKEALEKKGKEGSMEKQTSKGRKKTSESITEKKKKGGDTENK